MSSSRIVIQLLHLALFVAIVLMQVVVQEACAAGAEAATGAAAFSAGGAFISSTNDEAEASLDDEADAALDDDVEADTAGDIESALDRARAAADEYRGSDDGYRLASVGSAQDDDRSDTRRDDRYYPRRSRGSVQFRYRDDGFSDVYLTGSFNGWTRQAMDFDEYGEVWNIRVELPEGRHEYQFQVRKRGEVFEAIDPSNPEAKRTRQYGWVSVIYVDDDGYPERSEKKKHKRRRYTSRYTWYEDARFPLEYQRVDGVFLNAWPTWRHYEDYSPSIATHVGYGFSSKKWSGWVELEQPLIPSHHLQVVFSAYSRTDFTEQTGIGAFENTIGAAFATQDYRDYYRREGGTIAAVLDNFDLVRLEAGFHSDTFSSLPTTNNGSWGSGDLPPNPEITEGWARAWYGMVRVGMPTNYLRFDFETTGRGWALGDFDYALFTATARGRVKMGRQQWFDLRVKGGSNLRGELPIQKQYVLGGLGTIRGQGYQSALILDPDRPENAPLPLGGQRMALFNADYNFNLFDDVNMVLFFDSGMSWEDRNADMSIDQWKSGYGIGFQIGDGDFRVNIAKTMDSSADPIAQLRINRMF